MLYFFPASPLSLMERHIAKQNKMQHLPELKAQMKHDFVVDNEDSIGRKSSVIPGNGGAAELCEWSIDPISQSQSSFAPPIPGITPHSQYLYRKWTWRSL
ncbi:hypothetical protein Y032_0035g3151 [Ancylostoma ceylanicum]|uniref:Uncharacterized protein n=1 Tax=Ancylostoma ceylanicum TaxID=53326 RepID=A0A016ULQ6_9BILA|nr:hypothetical protein Y032_0035g3151 [Ancylostoma ceylanicum]